MVEQENCTRVTRAAAKKRAAESAGLMEEKAVNKKRVVLGELSNLTNVVVSGNKVQGKENQKKQLKGKQKAKTRVVKPALKVKEEEVEHEKAVDIDAKSDDPQMCGHYVSEIYEYLRQMEVDPKRRPVPDYVEKVQKDVSANMRGILLDWLVEVAEEYKYEGINPPNVENFCNITDDTYRKDEADILKSLKFELGNPTVKTFLRRFTRVAQEDNEASSLQLDFLGCYLAELSLLDYGCVKFLPSMVACSVMFLARFIIRPKRHPWSSAMQQYSSYKASDLKECVLIIHDLYLSRRGGALQAVREKYKQHKFKCVATMPASPEIPASYFEDVQEVDIPYIKDVQAVEV